MNFMKVLNKYAMPAIIIILLLSFIIYASTKEGFSNNCTCPGGSELRNGGCYSCETGYTLSTDYYNVYCVNSEKSVKPAIVKNVAC